MAYRSRYRGDFEGIGRLMKLPGVQLACRKAALEIQAAAESHAPVGNPETDRHSGLYKRSFVVIPIEKNVPWQGKPRRRVGARVLNTAPHALLVEFGNGATPRYAVFQKAVEDVAARFR
ncbi:HK97 gp10 family phage protein [Streptomyces sp. NPDC048560]|uniref:HK97 gp10 family phage protein n=1 Tax=Streptomyces sp. NPDC048560 TaxID=3155488 RepID=UPI0034160C8F